MSLRTVLVLLGLVLLVEARAAERDLRKTFPVQPGCALVLDSYRGRVTIEESDAAEIALSLQMETGVDDAAAERVFRTLELDLKQEGNTVRLRARNPSQTRIRFIWQEKEVINLTFRVRVPRRCDLAVTLGQGSLTVGNIAGRHTARVETGNVFFRRIDGSIEARTDTGDVIVSRCSGALTARVREGVIRAGTVGGRAELHTDSGDIDVLVTEGGIKAETGLGDITVGFADVVRAENRVRTSAGNITAKFGPKSDCLIEAASVWSRVESMLPLAIESGALGKKQVLGRLNAGGPRVVLHADGGGVRILPRDYELE